MLLVKGATLFYDPERDGIYTSEHGIELKLKTHYSSAVRRAGEKSLTQN